MAKKRVDKWQHYRAFNQSTCLEMAWQMGFTLNEEDYQAMLLKYDTLQKAAQAIWRKFKVKAGDYDFDEDGYDRDVILAILENCQQKAPVIASEFSELADQADSLQESEVGQDATQDNQNLSAYENLFEKALFIAQARHFDEQALLNETGLDVLSLVPAYLQLAEHLYPHHEMDQVIHFERLMSRLCSEFEQVHQKYGQNVMMSLADLYAHHSQLDKAHQLYRYLLRDNDLVDYIYLRYASLFASLSEKETAQALAQEGLRYVDERFLYYPELVKLAS